MARDDYSHPHYPHSLKYTKQYKLVCKDFMSLSLWLLLSLHVYSDFILVKKKNACELSFTPGWECKMVWLLWKTV